MKIFITIFLLLTTQFTFSQTLTETEIFNLTFKGKTDAYNLKYDKSGTNYCYVYRTDEENKNFIISPNSLSDKYDYIEPLQIIFDDAGNYYTIATDYKEEYGSDNYFLIVNGEQVKNYNYMEMYSCYLNKKNEFVFIFKSKEKYRIGYYNINGNFRQSDEYDYIRLAVDFEMLLNQTEGDMIAYDDKYFFKNKNGERAFIATIDGKTSIIFETEEIKTDYGDISETSLKYNNNNELSYIAKKTGRFYEYAGGEFVVSGNKVYNSFGVVSSPVLFNRNNEPVYIAGDSIGEFTYSYYVLTGNEKLPYQKDVLFKDFPANFGNYISNLKINNNGSVTYIGSGDLMVSSGNVDPDGNAYDTYFTKSFLLKDNEGYELGYNIGDVKYNSNGDMLYTAIADLKKKDRLLMLNYGSSRIIISKKKFDDIYDYGFTPEGEVVYAGQTYQDENRNGEYSTSVYTGDNLIGVYSYLGYQYYNDSAYFMTFGTGGKYAFAAGNKLDSVNNEYFIMTNEGRLPFPKNFSNSERFEFITNLMYLKNNKLIYIADTKTDPETYESTKEVFIDNVSLGKTYETIYDFRYDESINEVSFTGSRDNLIYLVKIKM